MREIKFNVYEFDELPRETQEKIVSKYWDINVDVSEWYKPVFDLAKNIGVEIKSFNLEDDDIQATLDYDVSTTIKLIFDEYNETASMYKLAKKYEEAYRDLVFNYSDHINYNSLKDSFMEEFEEDVYKELLDALQELWNHLTTDAEVIDYIRLNKYEFKENGEMYNA